MGNNLVGQTLGKYRIDEWLGGGGFAEVYKGYQTDLERVVAIKVLDDRLARDSRFIERFRREAENTFSLKHENIVEVYDFQEANGTYYMAMEYIDGPSLRKWLSKKGEFNVMDEEDVTRIHEDDIDNEATVLRELVTSYELPDLGLVSQIAIHVCNALDYAHQQKVIHRDVKPDNVLLSSDGRALLVDFGIARAQEDSRLTRTKAAIGSLAYMSPEQIRGEKKIDGRADIYSFGIMLYELLTGTVPFVGVDTAVFRMHLNDEPLKPTTLRGDIPTKLEKIVLKCLKKDPDARFQTAGEIAKALRDSVHPTPLSAIFETGKEKVSTKKKSEKTGQKAVICDSCGYLIPPEQQQEVCPACGDPLTVKDVEFTQKILQRGQDFVDSLKLKPSMSLDVRAYEYDRVMVFKLGDYARAALLAWQTALGKGSVVLPVLEPQDRPDPKLINEALNKLNDIVNLWESDAVNAFVVSLEARRSRREFLTELKAKTCYLYGTFHTLRASGCSDNYAMVDEYTTAKGWFDKAVEIIGDSKSNILSSANLCSKIVENILLYPSNCAEAVDHLKAIQADLKEVLQPWSEEDAAQCEIQINLQNEIAKIPVEMKDLHDRIQSNTTLLHGRIEPAQKDLGNQFETILLEKGKQKNASLGWGLAFWILFFVAFGFFISSLVQASNGDPSGAMIAFSLIGSILFFILGVNNGKMSLNRKRKAHKNSMRQVSNLHQLSQQILSGLGDGSQEIDRQMGVIKERIRHQRSLLESAYLHGPTPDLFVEHRARESDLKVLQRDLESQQEDARNLVRKVLQVGNTEVYDLSGVSLNGEKGKLAFEISNLAFRKGGNANLEAADRERFIRIRIPRHQITGIYPSYSRMDIQYSGLTAIFMKDKKGDLLGRLVNEWVEAGQS